MEKCSSIAHAEQEQLDEPWSKAVEPNPQFTIDFPQGCSRREAMRIAHWSLARFHKQVDHEALEAAAIQHKAKASKDILTQRCADIAKEAMDRSKVAELGLEVVLDTPVEEAVVISKAKALYAKVVEKIDKELKDIDEATKEQEKKKKENEEALLTKQPEQLFESAVAHIIKKHEQTAMDTGEGDDLCSKFVDAVVPKNGESPRVASGQNQIQDKNPKSKPQNAFGSNLYKGKGISQTKIQALLQKASAKGKGKGKTPYGKYLSHAMFAKSIPTKAMNKGKGKIGSKGKGKIGKKGKAKITSPNFLGKGGKTS